MQIRQFTWDVVDSNSWLAIEGERGLLIDAVDSGELYEAAARLDSLTIIITHCHFDHIVGLNKLRELQLENRVISTALCSQYMGDARKNTSNTATVYLSFYRHGEKANMKIEPFVCKPSEKTFTADTEFEWCGHSICLSAVHGHSADSLIAVLDNKYLFSGDTLLPIQTVAKRPSGSIECFWKEDVPKLRKLRADIVYPGHGAPGKKEDMLAVNVMPEKYKAGREIHNKL